MPDNQNIPLESIHNYTDRELLLLTVDRINGLTGEVRNCIGLLNDRVTRKEYEDHVGEGKKMYEEVKGEIKEVKGRIYKLENGTENGQVRESSIKEFKARIWMVVVGFIAIMEFIILVVNNLKTE